MKNKEFGRATYRKGKLYFDTQGWATVKQVARDSHQSPTKVVTAALWRYIKREKKVQGQR